MIRLAALALLLCATAAQAAECRKDTYNGNAYTLCEVAPAEEKLRLFLWDSDDLLYGHFGSIDRGIAAAGQTAWLCHERRHVP